MADNQIGVTHIDVNKKETVNTYFKTMISFSHITGSVTSILVDYIRAVFNNSYLKTVFNTAEVPFAQRNKQSMIDVINKPKPMLIIEPKFDPSDDVNFRPQTEFDSWIANSPNDQIRMALRTASPLIKMHNYALYFNPRRYRMSFNISFVFDSNQQMIQCLEYFRQSIRHGSQMVGYKYIENLIPTDYMKAISKITGFDIMSDKFIDYLNIHSVAPISRRIRTGSGNCEFFATQRTPTEITFIEGPSTSEPVKRGNLVVSASFSESITFEFTAYSTLVLVTNVNLGEDLPSKFSLMDNETESIGVGTNDISLVVAPHTEDVEDRFVKTKSVLMQADKQGETSNINIYDLVSDQNIKQFIRNYQKMNKSIDFIHILLHRGLEKLDNQSFSVDYEKMILTIPNMDIYNVYTVSIYVDNAILGNNIQEMYSTDDSIKLRKDTIQYEHI